MELLKEKTIILSTHQVHFLDQCDYLIALEKGELLGCDKPDRLHIEDLMEK